MKRLLFFLLVALWGISSSNTSAAVFERDWKTPGDGLLTYDDISRREWLDVTESVLNEFPGANHFDKLASAIAEAQPGGAFEGFMLAETTDVTALAESAGINTQTLDYQINEVETRKLVQLLGATFSYADGTIGSQGFTGDFINRPPFAEPQRLATVFIVRSDGISAGLFQDIFLEGLTDATTGLMLYRQVPEPSFVILVATALVSFFSTRSSLRAVAR